MQEWDDVLRAALLGTERQSSAFPAPQGAQPLAAALSALPSADPALRLLSAAGLLTVYRRAGNQPAEAAPPSAAPAPDAAQDRPRVGARAAGMLAQVLGNAKRPLVAEWLDCCASAGLRVPEEYLPALFEWGRLEKDLHGSIAAVAGLRGSWLAGQNQAWSFAQGASGLQAPEIGDSWETGSLPVRIGALAGLRATDPERARGMLEASWEQEDAEARAAFLRALAKGLSSADEPFLEKCLADRRKEVRTAAADLLVLLPGSRLVARMRERLAPLLEFGPGKKGILGKLAGARGTLAVTLPKDCDEGMQRDGIAEKPPGGRKIGQKQWWLQQMLAAVPPAAWCEAWKLEPEGLLALSEKTDYAEALREGLAAAALRARDEAWAVALLSSATKFQETESELFRLLAPAKREAIVQQALKSAKDSLADSAGTVSLILLCTHLWSEDFTQHVMKAVLAATASGKDAAQRAWHLRSSLKEFALRMPPRAALAAAEPWQKKPPGDDWQTVVSEFLALLQFRESMHSEFGRA